MAQMHEPFACYLRPLQVQTRQLICSAQIGEPFVSDTCSREAYVAKLFQRSKMSQSSVSDSSTIKVECFQILQTLYRFQPRVRYLCIPKIEGYQISTFLKLS